MSITWATIEALITERWAGRRASRFGSTRHYRVPSPTGGTFLIEITLRPRWCTLVVDRWRTTDRDEAAAEPWFKEHVWPVVIRAHDSKRTGSGILPSGNATISSAFPIVRADLLSVLTAWVDAELTWGVPKEAMRGPAARAALSTPPDTDPDKITDNRED